LDMLRFGGKKRDLATGAPHGRAHHMPHMQHRSITIHHVPETSSRRTEQDVTRSHNYRPSIETEAMMLQSDDIGGAPPMDFDAWRALLRSNCGRDVEVTTTNSFAGWIRPFNACGLEATSVKIRWGAANRGCSDYRAERRYRDVRCDGADHYLIMFQVAGQTEMTQIDQAAQLAEGDVALVDAARPVTYLSRFKSPHWLTLRLPRRLMRSHLGFEPQGVVSRQATRASRLLFDLVRDADMEAASSSADMYMQFAVYDLVGALFAPSDLRPISRSADKLFARIRGVVKDGLANPDFGPAELASEVGISLRYLQKLFTERTTTCSEFIYSHRLDHAAYLLHRRAAKGADQPLSEVAYACGFRDYAHFARRFRKRFGYSPGAHAGEGAVRSGTAESAFWARDGQSRTS
jgi:AraC family transcriptional regulator, positive regulator of tynA and feaB